jgi:DNA-3-methyladenine glycosylase II
MIRRFVPGSKQPVAHWTWRPIYRSGIVMQSFTLHPRPPYRLDLTVWVLRRLPVNAMDRWDGEAYRRVLVVDDIPVEVTVRQTGSSKAPRLRVELAAEQTASTMEKAVATTLTKMLGLNIDLTPFYQLAQTDPKLTALTSRFVGFKPPRLPTLFETMVNGIACQQISLSAGLQLLNRFCTAFGPEFGRQYAFPRPEDLDSARVEDFRKLGFSGRKGQGILDRARSIVEGTLDLEELSGMEDAAAVGRLRQLPGIGRWTAQYALLRGLGRLDVYPADDVGSQNKFMCWLSLEERPGYDAIHRIIDHWRPYRGLIYFYLLLDQQARQGLLEEAR